MTGIPIKFRGNDIFTGEYVFGDVIHDLKGVCIGGIINGEYATSEVNADSICQLVGYDDNGKEIYEEDKVKSAELEYFAALEPCIKIPNIGVSLPFLDVKKVSYGE